jgi:hypothetical protein
MSSLLGMQPRLMQVPPKAPESISATGTSGCPGMTTFPDPEPTTTSEK